ncbi:glycoside hydrolase family 99-like domain-containing protein [Candidatus Sumerlaeota bacterium]|nr:glycoside hydrolase family 99-like domain-containing protein [Candidatus Sumerlaeota bacterium]
MKSAGGENHPMMKVHTKQSESSEEILDIDTLSRASNLLIQSEPIRIESLGNYRFGGFIKRIEGEGRYNFSLQWLDKDKTVLGHEYAWVSELAGTDWQKDFIEAVAPEKARFATAVLESEPGKRFQAKGIELILLDEKKTDAAIDIIHDPIEKPDKAFTLKARIENRGNIRFEKTLVEIELPKGMQCQGNTRFTSGGLSFGESVTHELLLTGYPSSHEDAIICRIKAETSEGTRRFQRSSKPFITIAQEQVGTSFDLPAPQLPEMDIKLGCYYFPVMLDWERNNWGVRHVDYLKPKLGYYDESKPEVADWHIYWAVEHGVSFFVFDWYYNQGYCYLNDALEKGFLQSLFSDKMEFCIDWCNEGHCAEFKTLDFSLPTLEGFIRALCERYFIRKNYLRIEGKPVVIIHVPSKIVNAHGGWEGCKKALNRLREIARGYGHPGIYFAALQNNKPFLLDYAKGGFDCVTAYAYGMRDVPWDPATRSLPFEPLIPRHRECFEIAREEAHSQGLDYIPSAWVGWDDNARSRENAVRTTGNAPSAFRRMIETLPEYVEKDTKLALFESWNEWGEGGQAEPEEHWGFGRLGAIRDVLSKSRGPYTILTPSREERERLGSKITYDEVNEIYLSRYADELGLNKGIDLDFNSIYDLWLRPSSPMKDTRIESGCLSTVATTKDPVLTGPPFMRMPAERVASIRVRMRIENGNEGQLFWITEKERKWDEYRSIKFQIKADENFHEYNIEVARSPEWKGIILQIRFDPSDAAGKIDIDRFRTIMID